MSDTYETLLNRIILGRYAPGMELSEKAIAAELKSSRTPVREAFLRLKLEGLVRVIPRGGIFVNEVSMQEIQQISQMRLILEEHLANQCVKNFGPEDIEALQTWFAKVKRAWKRSDAREKMSFDVEFHDKIDALSRDGVLIHHLRLLRNKSVLFWGQLQNPQAETLDSIIKDFERAITTLKAKKAEQLTKVLHAHQLDHLKRVLSEIIPERVALKSLKAAGL